VAGLAWADAIPRGSARPRAAAPAAPFMKPRRPSENPKSDGLGD